MATPSRSHRLLSSLLNHVIPGRSSRDAVRRRNRTRSLNWSVEWMEPRTLLSTFTENSTGDTGAGTGTSGDLRFCITGANAAPGSTINFGVTGTIQLLSALPNISANMTISNVGGPYTVTVNGGGSSSNFSDF